MHAAICATVNGTKCRLKWQGDRKTAVTPKNVSPPRWLNKMWRKHSDPTNGAWGHDGTGHGRIQPIGCIGAWKKVFFITETLKRIFCVHIFYFNSTVLQRTLAKRKHSWPPNLRNAFKHRQKQNIFFFSLKIIKLDIFPWRRLQKRINFCVWYKGNSQNLLRPRAKLKSNI